MVKYKVEVGVMEPTQVISITIRWRHDQVKQD